MSRVSQIFDLAKLDFRRNFRSRGVKVMIFVLPLLIWSLQIGLMSLEVGDQPSLEGRDVYIVNHDVEFSGFAMGDLFVDILNSTTEVNDTIMYKANLNVLEIADPSKIQDTMLEMEYTPLIYIPENFSETYFQFVDVNSASPVVGLFFLPTDNSIMYEVEIVVNNIINTPPFSIRTFEQITDTRDGIVIEEGEEITDPITAWQVGFFVIYLGLIAPMPLVASGFAREREKNTLESIVALPIRPMDVLFGKFLGGAGLLAIFASMNMVGLYLYKSLIELLEFDLKTNVMIIDLSLRNFVLIFLTVFFTTTVAYSLGISLTSRVSDVRATESTYNIVMLIPFAIIALFILAAEPGPFHPIFILPWPHSIAIIFKGMFPNSFLTDTITGSYIGDVIIHFVVLLFYQLGALVLAGYLNQRGKIFRLGG